MPTSGPWPGLTGTLVRHDDYVGSPTLKRLFDLARPLEKTALQYPVQVTSHRHRARTHRRDTHGDESLLGERVPLQKVHGPSLALLHTFLFGASEHADAGGRAGFGGVAVRDRGELMKLDGLAVRGELRGDAFRRVLCGSIRLDDIPVRLEAFSSQFLTGDSRLSEGRHHRLERAQRSGLNGLSNGRLRRDGSRREFWHGDLGDGAAGLVKVMVDAWALLVKVDGCFGKRGRDLLRRCQSKAAPAESRRNN